MDEKGVRKPSVSSTKDTSVALGSKTFKVQIKYELEEHSGPKYLNGFVKYN